MKIVRVETLLSKGEFPKSSEWLDIREVIHQGIREMVWPEGGHEFLIYPQSGKRRNEGNGVKPIKNGLMKALERAAGWKKEQHFEMRGFESVGKIDAVYKSSAGLVGLEWETGNVSSSHRALNKMALGLLRGALIAGVLIVPTREMYRYLTDRVGNYNELLPYFDLWRSIPITCGVLELVAIEHDGTSLHAPRIPKGTDGRHRK